MLHSERGIAATLLVFAGKKRSSANAFVELDEQSKEFDVPNFSVIHEQQETDFA